MSAVMRPRHALAALLVALVVVLPACELFPPRQDGSWIELAPAVTVDA